MTVFTCFVLQDANIEGIFSVLSNQDCQFVNLLLSEKLKKRNQQTNCTSSFYRLRVQTKTARDWLGMKL